MAFSQHQRHQQQQQQHQHHMHDLHRTPLTVDTRYRLFEDEDGILDDNILDSSTLDSGLEMSPMAGNNRRSSFTSSAAIFSPKGEWDFTDRLPGSTSTNPFSIEQSNNPFMRLEAAEAAAYGQRPSLWGESGSCTPTAIYDGLPAEFNHNESSSAFLQNSSSLSSNTATFESHGVQPVSLFPSAAATAAPPPNVSSQSSGNEWALPEHTEARSIPKRMRPQTPSPRSHSPQLRRDGIRKKNARFEIPAERNLMNIDQLISQSTDDQEIKELKQQKRLLRNRQAALDSRQRKKQHTEQLEGEKKHYVAMISELEEDLGKFKIAATEWAHEKQQYEQYIASLHLEKEEMVRSHTLATGELRKKNIVLIEHLQKIENDRPMSVGMGAAGSSNEFNFDNVDGINMETNWDNFDFLPDFNVDPSKNTDNTLITTTKKEKSTFAEDDKPATGLLLILLLCGAWVASKSSTSSLPPMSADIRSASATLLSDIFKDAGVNNLNPTPSHISGSRVSDVSASSGSAAAAAATTTTWPAPASSSADSSMAGLTDSSLGVLESALAGPTKEQETEQLFSLSAEQYNTLTSSEFLSSRDPPSQPRRNIGESLAAMRLRAHEGDKSTAEVYTRSLMWDKVPKEVVRDFAKLIAEYNSGAEKDNVEEVG